MRPGAWDAGGFLGEDEALADRIAADLETCTRLGTTPEALGARLLDLLAEADAEAAAAAEPEVSLDTGAGELAAVPLCRVSIRHHEGAITCPWALEQDEVCLRGPGGNPSADEFTITLDGESLDGFTLSAHLIANHRFFGGLESRFRIDPTRAFAVLGPD
ncbi:MAG: hypothetical protein ACXV8G_00060 [Acidimicrobiales bacterium]